MNIVDESGHFDVVIVGGGIVGLAHAWRAASRGLRVLLVERARISEGASVRNFGMIWPIGQPAGELYETALESRELWLQLGANGVTQVETCGALHLAHQADELAVLDEFCQQRSHQASMLTAEEVCQRSTLANRGGCWGACIAALN